jgi:hypothetical protein
MAYAHGGYTCEGCGGHIGATCEPTGRMFPAASVVTDGMWYNGQFLCRKCQDKERAKILEYLRKKYPGNTDADKLNRALEGMRAIMAHRQKIFFYDGRLVLNVKGKYFNEILNGRKVKEYRKRTPYWMKRIEGKTFDIVEIRNGYPPQSSVEVSTLVFPWEGLTVETVTHKEFGKDPVEVYAINLNHEKMRMIRGA